MRQRSDEPTTGEWAVLALVDEGAKHGFAVALELAPDGEVGSVWSVPRSLVYRALDVLESFGFVERARTETSPAGPRRTLLATTPEGARRVEEWLRTPVERARQGRSELLLKLLFLARRQADATVLLQAQKERFSTREQHLRAQLEEEEGFARTLLLWRAESTGAALRFVEALDPR